MNAADPRSGPPGARKRLRVGHVSERGAVNAARTLLEAHGLVVDEVDGRNDYGRDLSVDITEGREVTGALIGVQVKGDKRFIREGAAWQLPVTPKDVRYWAESSVPILGILQNSRSGELRWVNLTAYARADPALSKWPPGRKTATPDPPAVVLLAESQVLDQTSLPRVLDEMREYVRRNSGQALLGLFDHDDDLRVRAVHDCWTLGRGDARAFLLLRHALPSLAAHSLRDAVVVLSHLVPHPDIFWHAGNWIPLEIEDQVRQSFRWSAQEISDLVGAVERWSEDTGDVAWERGGLGQCLYHLLVEDPLLRATLPHSLPIALSAGNLEAAFRLLILIQYLANDAYAAAEEALAQNPALQAHWFTAEFMEQIAESGFVAVY